MDGVLEATITLCGCKVLCSLLCLSAVKDSLSSVSLCCSCLLLFTDLSITVFLAYLWCVAPKPVSNHPSLDSIALRFMLFLCNTYGTVLILTPILVAVEVLLCHLWHQEVATFKNSIETNMKEHAPSDLDPVMLLMDADEEDLEIVPLQKGKLSKAVGFLGCLLLWCVSGTYAGSSWKQDQQMVRECLEKGGSLYACLPCLLTASSPISGQISWSLAVTLVILGFCLSKLAQLLVLVSQENQLNMSREMGSASGFYFRTFYKWVGDQDGSESRMQKRNFLLDRTTECNGSADSTKTADSCTAQSLQSEYNEARRAHGNPVQFSDQTGLAEGCKLHCKGALLVSQQHSELFLLGTEAAESMGLALQTKLWNARRESPFPRGGLMTGLVCGLLVCVFPTVLSTNILLVSSLDTLVANTVKYLLFTTHSK